MRTLRQIFGVTLVTLRALVRTKTVPALALLLLLCVILLPRLITGDGTPAGAFTILLTYTLGFAFGVLCLVTLIAACGLFAAEIDSTRIHLTVVKPLTTFQLWLGKWLALVMLSVTLLTGIYALVYAQIMLNMRQPAWKEEVQLVSRHVVHPTLPSLDEEARLIYAEMYRQNALPTNRTERQILSTLAARAHDRYDVINPGESMKWLFTVPQPLASNSVVTVRIRFDTEYSTRTKVIGGCRLATTAHPNEGIEIDVNDLTQNEIVFDVDLRAFNGLSPTGFELSFQHRGDPEKSAGLMVRPRQDVALLTTASSFEANLVRALIVQGSILALLAAFGLMLGACFSLPVALFAALILLVVVQIGESVVDITSDEDTEVLSNQIGLWVSEAATTLTAHAEAGAPLEALAHGEAIERERIVQNLLWNVLGTPLLFALISAGILRRRELAND